MREKVLYLLGVLAVALMAYNLTEIAARPLRALFYVPLCGTAALAAVTSLAASIAFLRTRNFRFDSLAVAATEACLAFLAAGIVNGCILIHAAEGKWWTWDSRLTAALVCWLLYATYLMLRHAVLEPTQRAASSAVWSVFAFLDVPLAVVTIQWWKPGIHLRADWSWSRFCNLGALVLLGALFTMVRMRQEETRREMDSLRRMTHAL